VKYVNNCLYWYVTYKNCSMSSKSCITITTNKSHAATRKLHDAACFFPAPKDSWIVVCFSLRLKTNAVIAPALLTWGWILGMLTDIRIIDPESIVWGRNRVELREGPKVESIDRIDRLTVELSWGNGSRLSRLIRWCTHWIQHWWNEQNIGDLMIC